MAARWLALREVHPGEAVLDLEQIHWFLLCLRVRGVPVASLVRELRAHLLPHGQVIGWCPGNYCGYPLFQFYFPLPFLVISGLSLLVPFQVALSPLVSMVE